MTEQFLRASRDRIFSGVDRDLYLHVGYFMTWFNQVEGHLTFLFAKVLKMRDLEQFELLIGGMDARVKCERLKKGCALYSPMGPQLGARIDWFEDKVVKLRNKVAHRLVMKHDEDEIFYLTTTTRKPYKDIGRMEQIGPEPEKFSGLALQLHLPLVR